MNPEPPVKTKSDSLRAVILIVSVIVGILAVYFLVRQIYIDTHCATILGTQICR